MTELRVGDHVRVHKQPRTINPHVPLEGKFGIIIEIFSTYANIQFFDLDTGRLEGSGSVPLACLERTSDPRLADAKRAYEQCLEKMRLDMQKAADAKARRRNDLREELAELEHDHWKVVCEHLLETIRDELTRHLHFHEFDEDTLEKLRCVRRWKETARQVYRDLPEQEKGFRRSWADRALELVEKHANEQRREGAYHD